MHAHTDRNTHTQTHTRGLGRAPRTEDKAADSWSLAIASFLHRENTRNTFLKGALSFAGVLPFLGERGTVTHTHLHTHTHTHKSVEKGLKKGDEG